MLCQDTYRTVNAISKGIIKVKSSKFISISIPVDSETDINERLKAIKKEYYDANHHCYAFRLGFDKQLFRFSDDREPSGTAGRPIFGQILSNDLTNILVVVVRYFGGTKLGVSGLISAYKNAAAESLKDSDIIVKTVNEIYIIEFEYEAMNDVMKIIKDQEVQIIESVYDQRCSLKISIRKRAANFCLEELNKIKNISCNFLVTK